MTRLELLKTVYTPQQIRDAWIHMGQQVVNTWTKTYTKNSLFRVQQNNVQLTGYLVFCTEDFVDQSFDWSQWTVEDFSKGTIINTDGITHPYLYVVLTQDQFTLLNNVDFDPSFVPFKEADLDDSIEISDFELNLILRDVGVPFISINELEYNRKNIIDLCVYPAVMEYFKWFPIITCQNYVVSSTKFEIPIPDWAFTAQRAFITPGYPASSSYGNPFSYFVNEFYYSIGPYGGFPPISGVSGRRQRFRDPQALSTYILEKAVRRGAANMATRMRIKISHVQKKIIGYSSVSGLLEVEWSSFSRKWDDIPFNRQNEVRKLATAYTLRTLGMLRGQLKTDIPGIVDYNQFITRADTLETDVISLWKASTKPVIIRS